MSTYPSAVLVKADVINEVDVVDQNDHNILKGEIIALQTNIGTNPQGQLGNFMARFNAMHNGSGLLYQTAGNLLPTAPGKFWYDTDADQMKFIRDDGTVLSVGGGFSNLLYRSQMDNTDPSWGFVKNQATFTATVPPASNNYAYWVFNPSDGLWADGGPKVKFRKFSGVNTLRTVASRWGDGLNSAQYSFGISSAGTSSGGTLNSSTPTSEELTLDVSGLANGTTYTVTFQMRRQSGGAQTYLGEINIFGE